MLLFYVSCVASACNLYSLWILSYLCTVYVVFDVRGQQYIAQTPAPASILHAPGRSECWHQLCLWPVDQSPQLLQLLWYFHEPLSIQQPHEPCRQRALPTGQSCKLYLETSIRTIYNAPLYEVLTFFIYNVFHLPSPSSHCSEYVIVFEWN